MATFWKYLSCKLQNDPFKTENEDDDHSNVFPVPTVFWFPLYLGSLCIWVPTVSGFPLYSGFHCILVPTVSGFPLYSGSHCILVPTVSGFPLYLTLDKCQAQQLSALQQLLLLSNFYNVLPKVKRPSLIKFLTQKVFIFKNQI